MKIKIRQSDKLFSLYIREKASWKCERCGAQHKKGSRGLHCSHYVGRSNEATRFDTDNCCAHCHGCHAYFTANPYAFTEWKKKQLGKQRFNQLMVRAYQTHKKRDDKMDLLIAKELIKTLEHGEDVLREAQGR